MKKILRLTIISVLFFLCIKSYAQFNPVWNAVYQQTPSLNFSNESRKVVVDASGNVFVLADVTSDIDPFGIFTGNTYHYTVLLKYDASGNLVDDENLYVVNHIASGFDNKGAFGLELDSAGNVYVGFTTFSLFNDFDANIVKYDNNLTQIWFYQFKPPSQDFGIDMKVSQSGTAYAIARSVSGTDTTYHVLSANSSVVATIPLYSFDMNIDVLSRLVVDVNEDVYVTGYQTISGFKAVLTAKVNASGNLNWKRTYNGGSSNRDDIGTNLVIGVDGYLYVTGSSDRGSPLNYDILLMKSNTTNGKNAWIDFYDFFTGNEQGYFVFAPDLDYVYVGSVSSNYILIDRIKTPSGSRAGRVAYQPDLASPYSALNGSTLSDMKISSNMSFYLTGNMFATDSIGQTFSAAFIAKYELDPSLRLVFSLQSDIHAEGDFNESMSSTGIALDEMNEKVIWLRDKFYDFATHSNEIVELKVFDVPSPFKSALTYDMINDQNVFVYPNPAHNFISINSTHSISKVEMFDLAGQEVKTVWMESGNNKIALDDLMTGIYLTKIYLESGEITNLKILKN